MVHLCRKEQDLVSCSECRCNLYFAFAPLSRAEFFVNAFRSSLHPLNPTASSEESQGARIDDATPLCILFPKMQLSISAHALRGQSLPPLITTRSEHLHARFHARNHLFNEIRGRHRFWRLRKSPQALDCQFSSLSILQIRL